MQVEQKVQGGGHVLGHQHAQHSGRQGCWVECRVQQASNKTVRTTAMRGCAVSLTPSCCMYSQEAGQAGPCVQLSTSHQRMAVQLPT